MIVLVFCSRSAMERLITDPVTPSMVPRQNRSARNVRGSRNIGPPSHSWSPTRNMHKYSRVSVLFWHL